MAPLSVAEGGPGAASVPAAEFVPPFGAPPERPEVEQRHVNVLGAVRRSRRDCRDSRPVPRWPGSREPTAAPRRPTTASSSTLGGAGGYGGLPSGRLVVECPVAEARRKQAGR